MVLTLDEMGRLIVPKILCDQFALKPGDEFDVTLEFDSIHLRPRTRAATTLQNGILVCSSELPSSAWDLGDFMENQRDQRGHEIGGP